MFRMSFYLTPIANILVIFVFAFLTFAGPAQAQSDSREIVFDFIRHQNNKAQLLSNCGPQTKSLLELSRAEEENHFLRGVIVHQVDQLSCEMQLLNQMSVGLPEDMVGESKTSLQKLKETFPELTVAPHIQQWPNPPPSNESARKRQNAVLESMYPDLAALRPIREARKALESSIAIQEAAEKRATQIDFKVSFKEKISDGRAKLDELLLQENAAFSRLPYVTHPAMRKFVEVYVDKKSGQSSWLSQDEFLAAATNVSGKESFQKLFIEDAFESAVREMSDTSLLNQDLRNETFLKKYAGIGFQQIAAESANPSDPAGTLLASAAAKRVAEKFGVPESELAHQLTEAVASGAALFPPLTPVAAAYLGVQDLFTASKTCSNHRGPSGFRTGTCEAIQKGFVSSPPEFSGQTRDKYGCMKALAIAGIAALPGFGKAATKAWKIKQIGRELQVAEHELDTVVTESKLLSQDPHPQITTLGLNDETYAINRMKADFLEAAQPIPLSPDDLGKPHLDGAIGKELDRIPGRCAQNPQDCQYPSIVYSMDIPEKKLPYKIELTPVQHTAVPLQIIHEGQGIQITDTIIASKFKNGSQGVVYLGYLKDGTPVAVKRYLRLNGKPRPVMDIAEIESGQKINQLGVNGNSFLGVIPQKGNDKVTMGLVFKIIPGDSQGGPANLQTMKDVEEIIKRLKSGGFENPSDIQFLRTKSGRVIVIDEIKQVDRDTSFPSAATLRGKNVIALSIADGRTYLNELKKTDPKSYHDVIRAVRNEASYDPEVSKKLKLWAPD